MIYFDGIELPDLTWLDPFDITAVSAATRRRLDGGLTVFTRPLFGGRPITLEAPPDQALTLDQAQQLAERAARPQGIYLLEFPLRGPLSFQVRFRWEEGTPLDLRPLIDYADPVADDWVIGTIKLITV